MRRVKILLTKKRFFVQSHIFAEGGAFLYYFSPTMSLKSHKTNKFVLFNKISTNLFVQLKYSPYLCGIKKTIKNNKKNLFKIKIMTTIVMTNANGRINVSAVGVVEICCHECHCRHRYEVTVVGEKWSQPGNEHLPDSHQNFIAEYFDVTPINGGGYSDEFVVSSLLKQEGSDSIDDFLRCNSFLSHN